MTKQQHYLHYTIIGKDKGGREVGREVLHDPDGEYFGHGVADMLGRDRVAMIEIHPGKHTSEAALALLIEWRDTLACEVDEDTALEAPVDMVARLERIIALLEETHGAQ